MGQRGIGSGCDHACVALFPHVSPPAERRTTENHNRRLFLLRSERPSERAGQRCLLCIATRFSLLCAQHGFFSASSAVFCFFGCGLKPRKAKASRPSMMKARSALSSARLGNGISHSTSQGRQALSLWVEASSLFVLPLDLACWASVTVGNQCREAAKHVLDLKAC
jgi:hypothetical protein